MKQVLQNRKIRAGVSLVLVLALMLGVGAAIARQETVEPENPIGESVLADIGALTLGEAGGTPGESGRPADGPASGETGGASGGETGTEGGNAQPETPEDKPDDPPEENTDPQGQKPEEQQTPDTPEKPRDPVPGETNPQPEGTDPNDTGKGEVQLEGNTGGEGGSLTELELGLVMEWYQYGDSRRTIVCAPDRAVQRTVLRQQLENDRFRYRLSFTGADADTAEITEVRFGTRNGRLRTAGERDEVELTLPGDLDARTYVFEVTAEIREGDSAQQVRFEIVLRYEDGLDLDLVLRWQETDGRTPRVTCGADREAAGEIRSTALTDGELSYTLSLEGENARDARLLQAEYRSDSGDRGTLEEGRGLMLLRLPEGEKRETYFIEAEAEVPTEEGPVQTVYFSIRLTYIRELDLALEFVWFDQDGASHKSLCRPEGRAEDSVPASALAGGRLQYQLDFSGAGADSAHIQSVICRQKGGGTQDLGRENAGYFDMTVPEGASRARYTLDVTARVGEELLPFTVILTMQGDVSLEMHYTLEIDGRSEEQLLVCKNGRQASPADPIYTDQLTENQLRYSLRLTGGDAGSARITAVDCYQSGSGRTERLSESGTVTLLTDGGKTGENTFRVTAEDGEKTYQFTLNLPLKPKGSNQIFIETNLTEGQEITNGQDVSLTVRAFSRDAEGNEYPILATGTDTRLEVTFDGARQRSNGGTGRTQEYVLFPENPETGDENEHILYIYAEDAFGSSGELTLTLRGLRSLEGQLLGYADVYVDMSVLGLGTEGPIRYAVLQGEMVDDVVKKAICNFTPPEPFLPAESSLNWPEISFSERGGDFYLQRLGDGSGLGSRATAVDAAKWPDLGRTDEEILAAIDGLFGADSPEAALWRCIYRNGLTLSSRERDSIGEFDFTSGSGWLYEINGHVPGKGMSKVDLKPGDRLTLRYTLAYGWDVGEGERGHGITVGYCVSAKNGRITVRHEYETVTLPDGTTAEVCRCCGRVKGCDHDNAVWVDLGDGTCQLTCPDCGKTIGEAQEHEWEYVPDEGNLTHTRRCVHCGLSESGLEHRWRDDENTATCISPGELTHHCVDCGFAETIPSEPSGHQFDGVWHHDDAGHYQRCTVCGEIIEESRGRHDYVYDGDGIWECTVCGAAHGFDTCTASIKDMIPVKSRCTCEHMVYDCPVCGYRFELDGAPGEFPEYHQYENGVCTICGATDPNYTEPDPGPDNPDPGPDVPDPGPGGGEEGGGGEPEPAPCTHEFAYDPVLMDWVCALCGARHQDTACGLLPEEMTPDSRRSDCSRLVYFCPVCGEKLIIEGAPGDFPDYHDFADGVCRICGAPDPDWIAPDPDYTEPDPGPEAGGGGLSPRALLPEADTQDFMEKSWRKKK